MNILFPIAGRGQRFENYPQNVPKPLVVVDGKTLLEHSISTLGFVGQYIFVTLKYDNANWNQQIEAIIHSLQPNSKIITIPTPTEGMAETCLAAKEYIDDATQLIITNVDQILSWNPSNFLDFVHDSNVDACVSVYDHHDIEIGKPGKYAYVRLNDDGYAREFKEKFAISNIAMNGIYYWKHGSDFVRSAEQMIRDNIRVNNEYYVSPSYNYLIVEGKKINTYTMHETEFYSLGSPEEIDRSLQQIHFNQ